jgi:hypothetical protein
MADLVVDSNLSGSVGTSVSGTFGAVGPVTIGGIPNSYTIRVPEIGKVSFGMDPVQSTVTLQPMRITFDPIETSISIRSIPGMRAHLPVNYSVCFSVMGVELAAVRLCGEGMVITEPYQPNPCEVCGPSRVVSTDSRPAAPNRATNR